MKIAPIIVAVSLLAVTAHAGAEATLTPHSAVYKVKISLLSGRLSTSLQKTDDGYVANHVIKATGLFRGFARGSMNVTSEFAESGDNLEPVHFQSIDTLRDDPDVDLRFDWSRNHVSGTVGDDDFAQQLDGISYDSVSIQYELMRDLLNGGPSDTYVLFDVDKMRIANVKNVGNKAVKTKAGKFTAVGIQHQKEGSSRVTTLWCVEELGYLPVVIEQHRKGKLNFKASLLSYTPIA